jgi:hypothetical protein
LAKKGAYGAVNVAQPVPDRASDRQIGLIPFFVAYLGVIQNLGIVAFLLAGALVKLAEQSQWAWFVLVLLFSVNTMFAYIFAGPTASKVAKV